MAGALVQGANGGCRRSRRRPMRGDRTGVMRWRRSMHRRCSAYVQPSLVRPANWRKCRPLPGPARPLRIVPDGAQARLSDARPIRPCTLRTTILQPSEKKAPCAGGSCGAGRSHYARIPLEHERNDARIQDNHSGRSRRTSRPSRMPRMNSSTSKGSLVVTTFSGSKSFGTSGHSRTSRHQRAHSTSVRRLAVAPQPLSTCHCR